MKRTHAGNVHWTPLEALTQAEAIRERDVLLASPPPGIENAATNLGLAPARDMDGTCLVIDVVDREDMDGPEEGVSAYLEIYDPVNLEDGHYVNHKMVKLSEEGITDLVYALLNHGGLSKDTLTRLGKQLRSEKEEA